MQALNSLHASQQATQMLQQTTPFLMLGRSHSPRRVVLRFSMLFIVPQNDMSMM